MGTRASDNSEGKEVSDVVEKRASDGSEGSEAKEVSDLCHSTCADSHNLYANEIAQLHQAKQPLNVFSF